MCVPKVYLLFLTSTAFVDTKANPCAMAGRGLFETFSIISICFYPFFEFFGKNFYPSIPKVESTDGKFALGNVTFATSGEVY